MGINFAFYSYLTGLEAATDQRWDQIMKINFLNITVQSVGATMAGILVVKEQIAMFADCSDSVGTLYIRQYAYTVGNYLVIIFQINSLQNMVRQYKFNTVENFAYASADVRVKM